MPAPTFAQVKLPRDRARRAREAALPASLYVVPPSSTPRPTPSAVAARCTKLGWDERLTLQPVPPRQGSWYAAPPHVDAHLLAGVPAGGALPPSFPTASPAEPGKSDLAFLVPPLPPIGASAASN